MCEKSDNRIVMRRLTTVISPMGSREAIDDFDRQRFRWRFDWVIQIKAGSPAGFARMVTSSGTDTSEGAVRRWRKADDAWVGGKHLRGIGRACEDVSVDWLLGLKEAQSTTEQFIDGQIDAGRFASFEE